MTQILLKIQNLHKTYYSKKNVSKNALCDVSFHLLKGEIFGLLGVNGAGKTTLSSIIASLHPPTKGTVLWNDRSIYDDLINYRKIIGFCPQHLGLDLNFTLEQSLLFQGRCYGFAKQKLKERVGTLLKKFELDQYAHSKVDILSGGYQQRFLIAKSLIHDPQLVILDEPTVGLDPQVRRKLWRHILKLKEEGATVILTTHYLDEAEKLSDRVCVIDEGKILIIDTPKKLKDDWKKKNLEDVFLHLLKGENEE